jgi:hypothetical protein
MELHWHTAKTNTNENAFAGVNMTVSGLNDVGDVEITVDEDLHVVIGYNHDDVWTTVVSDDAIYENGCIVLSLDGHVYKDGNVKVIGVAGIGSWQYEGSPLGAQGTLQSMYTVDVSLTAN